MSEVIISADKVSFSYRKKKGLFRYKYFQVLKNVSFDIRKGETVGIIGRNGVGKSTILRLLSGIYEPETGQITNNSTKTALLTLQLGFDQNLSGRDNVVISGMLLGYKKGFVASKLEEIKEFSELGSYFYEPIKTYSTGMRARLGFSAFTYLTPEVLLLDEILGVGDQEFKKKSLSAIKRLILSDHTVVIVSHSAATISELCDRLIWIEDGIVKKEGETDIVLTEYRDSFG